MALTDYPTLISNLNAMKDPADAWATFVTALLADIAQIRADAAVQATVESDCDTVSANLAAYGAAPFMAFFRGSPAGVPPGSGRTTG